MTVVTADQLQQVIANAANLHGQMMEKSFFLNPKLIRQQSCICMT